MNLTEDWGGILTPEQIAEIERVSGTQPAQAIRVNPLKIGREEAAVTWPELYGWQIEPVPFCPDGFRFTERAEGIGRTLEHRMGLFYIQDMASMLPGEMFGSLSKESPLVLDMAAAPGGKTTHLISKTGDHGLIVANDISGGRAGALLGNLRRWGSTSAVVTNLPGERLGKWLPDTFDAVLLDAPCSGENLRLEGGSKQRRVSARERRALHDRQLRLLLSAFAAAKVGGEIVYATCTIAPEEDEGVLDDFLGHVGAEAEIVRPPSLVDLPMGVTAFKGQTFDPRVGAAARLWPYLYDTGSFFSALIRKRAGADKKIERMPGGAKRGGFARLGQEETAKIATEMWEVWGFEIDAVLDAYDLELWRAGRFIHAIPRLLDVHFEALPVKAAGMLIGEDGMDGFLPSHEVTSRFAERFEIERVVVAEESVEAWLAGKEVEGKEIFTPVNRHGVPQRRKERSEGLKERLEDVVLVEDERGRFLGRGRMSGAGRIRGMFPAGF